MADEQTPQSDLIDDAIRQAERQLEAKLEALRMSALGETTAHTPDAAPDDVAVLRPTGAASASSMDDGSSWPGTSRDADLASSGAISGLTPGWEDDRPQPAGPSPSTGDEDWRQPEPVHSSWTGGQERPGQPEPTPPAPVHPPEPRRAEPAPSPAPRTGPVETVPTEEEMQFYAQTRTALRNLQQTSESLPSQVVGGVLGEVERVVRDELAAPNTTLRLIQQNLQQGLPQVAERVEAALRDEVEAPTAAIRQVQEELPAQLERVTRDVASGVSGELDRITGSIQGTITRDVGQLEQSIATNVTRMAQGLGEGVARVERNLSGLDESVGRYERGVHSEFERVEAALRSSIEDAHAGLRDDLVQPTETVRKLDDELPSRFGRIERAVAEQADTTRGEVLGEVRSVRVEVLDEVRSTRRDLSGVLVGLVDANQATLDRLAQVTSTLEQDRTSRAEDLEFLVDTMTTGWDGMAKAITTLYEQGSVASERIASLEARLEQATRALEGMEHHVRELQPAPVVVTVNHPDAQVSHATRSGYLLGNE